MTKKQYKQYLLEQMDAYLVKLSLDPKVSETKFVHMKVAIVGCKLIVKETHGFKTQPPHP